MKTVVFLVPSLAPAGSEQSFLRVANSIAEAGNKVSVIIFSPRLNLLSHLNDNIKVFKLNGKTSNPVFLMKLYFVLKKIKADVVFGWSLYANLAALLLSPKKINSKIIISERNYFPTGFKLEKNKLTTLKYKLTLIAIKKLYPKANIITANSSINVRFLRLFIGKGPKYELLPNSIDLSDIENKSNEFSVENTGENILKVLAVGRLELQKGFDLLLRAIHLVKEKINLKLIIVGDGSQKTKLKDLQKELRLNDVVTFEGFKSNPFPYYKWADICVLSSRHEGFPNVLVEAMGSGKACIAADCHTGPFEITEMGKLGILYPVEDYKALAEAIINLAADPELRKELGKKAQQKIKSEYDYSRMKNIYSQIID
ncbi:MAG: glycosyltransferase [Ignavibacteriales bacterium]|nr:MAG: glycosyltransferase [Ignavibacteriales bacterium]